MATLNLNQGPTCTHPQTHLLNIETCQRGLTLKEKSELILCTERSVNGFPSDKLKPPVCTFNTWNEIKRKLCKRNFTTEDESSRARFSQRCHLKKRTNVAHIWVSTLLSRQYGRLSGDQAFNVSSVLYLQSGPYRARGPGQVSDQVHILVFCFKTWPGLGFDRIFPHLS